VARIYKVSGMNKEKNEKVQQKKAMVKPDYHKVSGMNKEIDKKLQQKKAIVKPDYHGYGKSSTMPGFRRKRTTRSYKKDRSANEIYNNCASVPDSLLQFVGEIHKEDRITAADEVSLGGKTQEAIRLQNLYNDLEESLARVPTDEEYCAAAGKINMRAIRQIIEEGIEAKNRLVTSNLRMVQRVVNIYIRNGLSGQYNAGDLMQEGNMALIRAAEKFDPGRGFRFSTYAMYWIRSSIKSSQINQSRPIIVPQRLHEIYKRVQKVENEIFCDTGKKPAFDDLANAVNMTNTQLERCFTAMNQQCYSLDQALSNPLKPTEGSSNKATLYDKISARTDSFTQTRLERQFLKEDLISTLKEHLAPRDVDIILLRYGLMDEKTEPHGFSGPLTIKEVGRLVGLKPDKVRRILDTCLNQLKHLIAHDWKSTAFV